MEFGLHTPDAEQAIVAMGARLIYGGPKCANPFEVVHDRMTWVGSAIDKKLLEQWINGKFLPALRKWVRENYIRSNSDEVFDFASEGYAGRACPNGSYGYMYLDCWKA